MAALLRSRTITDAYRRELGELRDDATALATRLWNGVDPERIDATLSPILDAIDVVLVGAQEQAVAEAELYLQAFESSELGVGVDRPDLSPSEYGGRTRDGRRTRDVLALSGVSMQQASILPGATTSTIMLAGMARMVRCVRTESVDAARTAQNAAMDADDKVSGFYRATSGEPCAACLGVAGQRFATGDVFPIHGSCQCTAEPIMDGLPTRYGPPAGREIAESLSPQRVEALYGPERAALLSGSGSLDVLVEQQEAHQWGAVLFAAPAASIPA
jgi:hypothetical protein